MSSSEYVVIRNKYTGAEYAYPQSAHTDLPVLAVEAGFPERVGFSRWDLLHMQEYGHAARVGTAVLSLSITYDETD